MTQPFAAPLSTWRCALFAAGSTLLVGGCRDSMLVELLASGGACVATEGCGRPCTDDFACPTNLYCSADGACTADCTREGLECGKDRVCTDRGRCVDPVILPSPRDRYTGGVVEISAETLDVLRVVACADWSTDPAPSPASLMMVVDVSGSMSEPVNHAETKWEITRLALTEAISSLPGITAVGMLLYPNQPTAASSVPLAAEACVNVDAMVPVAPLAGSGSQQGNRLFAALWAPDTINGGTPTHDAYATAFAALTATPLPGEAHLLLITDGRPTFSQGCVGTGRSENPVDEQPIVEAIAAAHASGTRTFVIGSPGSEGLDHDDVDARPWLSRAARAGGTAPPGCEDDGPDYCHFDMVDETDFGTSLTAALRAISGEIVPCEYSVPPPAREEQHINLDTLNVAWTLADGSTQLFLRDDDSTCDEGWYLTEDESQIVLCQSSCDRVKATFETRLELLANCTEILR